MDQMDEMDPDLLSKPKCQPVGTVGQPTQGIKRVSIASLVRMTF